MQHMQWSAPGCEEMHVEGGFDDPEAATSTPSNSMNCTILHIQWSTCRSADTLLPFGMLLVSQRRRPAGLTGDGYSTHPHTFVA